MKFYEAYDRADQNSKLLIVRGFEKIVEIIKADGGERTFFILDEMASSNDEQLTQFVDAWEKMQTILVEDDLK